MVKARKVSGAERGRNPVRKAAAVKVVKRAQHVTASARRAIIKLPKTAWILFCKANRQRIIDGNRDLVFGDVCKELSTAWNQMTDEEKAPYVEEHKLDRTRYHDKKQNLTSLEVKALRRHRRQKRKARAGRPKIPLSAYMLFVTQRRAEICQGMDQRDFSSIGKRLGDAWQVLPALERETYARMAADARLTYEVELAAYETAQKAKKGGPVAIQSGL